MYSFCQLDTVTTAAVPSTYWEDNSDMFYIKVAALLVNTIVVSYFLNFLSSYVPRNDNVVKHGYAWSFHLWIIMEHSTPQLLQLVSPGPHWEDDSDNVLQFCYHEILNSQDCYEKEKTTLVSPFIEKPYLLRWYIEEKQTSKRSS